MTGNDSPGPLSNYRVLDLGTGWAGPMAGQLLADMGAQVVKVESRTRMDGLRKGRPIIADDVAGGDQGKWPDLQPVFHTLNRNKFSVTVNLKQPGGLRLFLRMVERSDVVLDNFAPGVMNRLGLSYDVLREANPRIVMASMPAVGLSGPLQDIVGYAPTLAGLSGMAALVGYEHSEPLGITQIPYSDSVAAITTVFAVLVALYERRTSGEGQFIEVSQWEAMLSLMPQIVLHTEVLGEDLEPSGSSHPLYFPHGSFRCVGSSDEWVSLSVRNQADWGGVLAAVGSISGLDAGSDVVERRAKRDVVVAAVSSWTRVRSADECAAILQAHSVPAFKVLDIEGLFMDEHLAARDAFVYVDHPLVGQELVPGVPWKLSRTPGSVRRAAPLLGGDNEHVLCELYGLTRSEFREMVVTGVVEVEEPRDAETTAD